ncbi:integral membrane protein 2C-like isoform X1 [Vanacampus margaritifer]
MVRITLHPTTSDKTEKGDEVDLVSNELSDLEKNTSSRIKKYFPVRLCTLLMSVLVILLGLVLGSIYTYRHFFPDQDPSVQLPDIPADVSVHADSYSNDSKIYEILSRAKEFNCHVVLSTKSCIMEMDVKVAISVEDNLQFMKVLMIRGPSNADNIVIVHDFTNGKTAYYDQVKQMCYVTVLNKNVVKAPSNLLELLSNTKSEIYFGNEYMLKDIQIMGKQLTDDKDLGSAIQEVCQNKMIFEMMPKEEGSAEFEIEFLNTCKHIVHFENCYFVETYICNPKAYNT